MSDLVVILLPIYQFNHDWLKEQLVSIANQTFRSFQCVVSSDGQMDSYQIVEINSILPDTRFKLVMQEKHLGLYLHVASLIKFHTSPFKYFVLCDQDDVWISEKLENQFSRIEKSGVSVVSSNAEIVDHKLERVKQRTNFDWFRVNSRNQKYGLVLNQLTGASGIYRTQDFIRSLPFPKMINANVCVHDHWLYLCAIAMRGIQFSEDCDWKYRQHHSNLIGASAHGNLLKRYVRGVKKSLEIFRMSFIDHYDPVIEQGIVFQDALINRFPETLESKIVFIGTKESQMNLPQTMRMIIDTNLEGMRLLLHNKQNHQKVHGK